MCGLFSWFGHNDKQPLDIQKTHQLLINRGSDSSGFWDTNLNNVLRKPPEEMTKALATISSEARSLSTNGIIFSRLATDQPILSKTQPIINGRFVFAGVGSIYNKEDLLNNDKESLDIENLVYSFLKNGKHTLTQSEGGYAFIIWDQEKKILYAARDTLGKRSLFYHYNKKDNAIYIASDIRYFWAAKVASPQINDKVANLYLNSRINICNTETPFRDISILPAGHILTWQQDIRSCELTSVNYLQDIKRSDHEQNCLPSLLEQAVEKRLSSDFIHSNAALCLSGGADSQAIFRTLLQLGKKIPCYTAYHSTFDNDYQIVKQQQEKYKKTVDIQLFNTELMLTRETLAEYLSIQSLPPSNLGAINQFILFKEMYKQGIRTIIMGDGADEIFLGYNWYLLAYLRDCTITGKDVDLDKMSNIWNTRVSNEVSLLTAYEIFQNKMDISTLPTPVKKAIMECRTVQVSKNDSLINALQRKDLFGARMKQHLYDGDFNAGAFSMEVRSPFLDHAIIRWGLSLSPDFIFKKQYKWLLDEIIPGELDNLAYSKKSGFYVNFSALYQYSNDDFDELLDKLSAQASFFESFSKLAFHDRIKWHKDYKLRLYVLMKVFDNAQKLFCSP